jgi:hypothetical protein
VKTGLVIRPANRYLNGMKTPKEKLSKKRPTGEKLRRWRVSILRARAHNLGTIEATDAKAAEAEAVKLFGLTDEQRKRLSIWERE